MACAWIVGALRAITARANASVGTLARGELHHCPRSAHGKYLGYITDLPDTHYVDLLHYNAQELRERLKIFYEIPYTQACDQCGFADGLKLVDFAIQVERTKHKKGKGGTPVGKR